MPFLRFIPEATDIDFVGVRYFAFAIDGLLLLISIVSIAVQGFNLGIDFTGGVKLEVKSERVIDLSRLETIRTQVGGLGFGQRDRPSEWPFSRSEISRPASRPELQGLSQCCETICLSCCR